MCSTLKKMFRKTTTYAVPTDVLELLAVIHRTYVNIDLEQSEFARQSPNRQLNSLIKMVKGDQNIARLLKRAGSDCVLEFPGGEWLSSSFVNPDTQRGKFLLFEPGDILTVRDLNEFALPIIDKTYTASAATFKLLGLQFGAADLLKALIEYSDNANYVARANRFHREFNG